MQNRSKYLLSLKIGFVVISLFISVTSNADTETLLNKMTKSGASGGPVLKITSIQSHMALFLGGNGAIALTPYLTVGPEFYGLISDIRVGDSDTDVTMKYGGLKIQGLFFSEKMIHFSLGALVGGGVLNLQNQTSSDTLFLTEPEVDVIFNITETFRLSLGLSYWYVQDIKTSGITDSDLSGLVGTMALHFGLF